MQTDPEKKELKEIKVIPGENTFPAVLPDRSMLTVAELARIIEERDAFIKNYLKRDRDYGIIRGTKKEALLKPGAEKLCGLFRLYPEYVGVGVIIDFDKKPPFFFFRYKCILRRIGTNEVIAEAIGSCNSHESKYRYRWVIKSKLPPGVDSESLPFRVKDDYHGGTYKEYQIENEDTAELANTFDQMAQKRAYVAVTRIATQTSDRFVSEEDSSRNGAPPSPAKGGKPSPASRSSGETNQVKTPQTKPVELPKITLTTKKAILLALKFAVLNDEERERIQAKVDMGDQNQVTGGDLFTEAEGLRTLKYIAFREKVDITKNTLFGHFVGDEQVGIDFAKRVLNLTRVDIDKLTESQLDTLTKAVLEEQKRKSSVKNGEPEKEKGSDGSELPF